MAGYFLLYCLVAGISVLLLCLFGNDMETSFFTMVTMFNNVGPCLSNGIGALGATASYATFNWMSKIVMMFDMLIGRLEIFPILLLFAPQSWSRRF